MKLVHLILLWRLCTMYIYYEKKSTFMYVINRCIVKINSNIRKKSQFWRHTFFKIGLDLDLVCKIFENSSISIYHFKNWSIITISTYFLFIFPIVWPFLDSSTYFSIFFFFKIIYIDFLLFFKRFSIPGNPSLWTSIF